MKFRYAGEHSEISFKRPGDRQKIKLKKGDEVEIEDRFVRAFVVSKQAERLGLVPSTDDGKARLAAMLRAGSQPLTKAVTPEDLAKEQTARGELEKELAELKANVLKNGHKAADEEVTRLSRELNAARDDAYREVTALHDKLKQSEARQAQLSEELIASRAANAAIEARLSALEKSKGK